MTRRSIILLQKKAEVALKKAVLHVIEDHKKMGKPLVVWQEGKVRFIPPTQRLMRKMK